VKNNLQTISALLRIQARRLENPEAKQVLEESVRRIQAISLVHETLSQEAGEDIDLGQVVEQLVRTVEEGLMSHERPIRFVVEGDVGIVPASVVTPLAVVLNELLQNVVDHAFPAARPLGEDGYVGVVRISLTRTGESVQMTVTDDGVGLPPGFDIDRTSGLGISIVGTLVTTELEGTLEMRPRQDQTGVVVDVVVPVDAGAAT
jgi:two-component sensor histidine kinase